MLHYFYGEDAYGARAAIGELAAERQARLQWLDGHGVTGEQLAAAVGRGPRGLFGIELVVARDVSLWPTGLQRDLLAALEAAGPRAEAVVWDREPDRRSSFFTQIQRHVKRVDGQAQEFRLPSSAAAAQWLLEQARQRGGAITPEGAELLVERVGTDRWALSAELDRLLLVTVKVSAETVRAEVALQASAEIFSMLEALSRGQRSAAVRSVQALLARGESEFYVLAMLAYQFRILHVIRRGLDRGFTERQIAVESALKPFVVQKNSRHAGRFTAAYLREALARILATDFAIRRGRVDQRTALLMLVLTLALRPRG